MKASIVAKIVKKDKTLVAANIPFTIPIIVLLGVFSLSLFTIVVAKAIRPIIAHKIIVDVLNLSIGNLTFGLALTLSARFLSGLMMQ